MPVLSVARTPEREAFLRTLRRYALAQQRRLMRLAPKTTDAGGTNSGVIVAFAGHHPNQKRWCG